MPHEGSADPVTNDGPRLHLNVPISELTERITRAIEASDVSSTPLVAQTADEVMITKMSQPLTRPLLRVGGSRKVGLTKRPNAQSQNDGSIIGRGYT